MDFFEKPQLEISKNSLTLTTKFNSKYRCLNIDFKAWKFTTLIIKELPELNSVAHKGGVYLDGPEFAILVGHRFLKKEKFIDLQKMSLCLVRYFNHLD